MGVPMNYGTCEGGPFHKRQMAHHEPSMPLAIDKHTKKAHPCLRTTSTDPNYEFGEYRWDGKRWLWTPPVHR